MASRSALKTVIGPVNVAPVAFGPDILLGEGPDHVLDGVQTRLAFHGQPPRPLRAFLEHQRAARAPPGRPPARTPAPRPARGAAGGRPRPTPPRAARRRA